MSLIERKKKVITYSKSTIFVKAMYKLTKIIILCSLQGTRCLLKVDSKKNKKITGRYFCENRS